MASYNITDICCPPQSSTNNGSKYSRNLLFILIIIISILIIISIGLWIGSVKKKSKQTESEHYYLILTRKWPITKCIGNECDSQYRSMQQWLINNFQIRIVNQLENNQNENIYCKNDEKDFDLKSMTNVNYFNKKWPNIGININNHPTTKPPTVTEVTILENDETKSTTLTTTKPDKDDKHQKIIEHNKIEWQKQWKKYGTCYKYGKQKDYFDMIEELNEKYDLKPDIANKYQSNLTIIIDIDELSEQLADYYNEKNKDDKDLSKMNAKMFEFKCKQIITNNNDDDEFNEDNDGGDDINSDNYNQQQKIYLLEEIGICFEMFENKNNNDNKKYQLKPIECYDRNSYSEESPFGCFGQKSIRYPSD